MTPEYAKLAALVFMVALGFLAFLFVAWLRFRSEQEQEPPDVVAAQILAGGGAYGLPWMPDDGKPIDNTTVYPPDHDHKAIPITLTMKDVMGHDEYYKWLESLKGQGDDAR